MDELSVDNIYTIDELKKYANSININLDDLFMCINIINKNNDKYKTINDVLVEAKKYINTYSLNNILNYIYLFSNNEIILPTDIDLSSSNVKGILPLSKLSTGIISNTDELDKFLIVDTENNIKIVNKDLINLNNIELSVDIELDKENNNKASTAKAVYSFTYSKDEIIKLIKQNISEIPLINEVIEYQPSIQIQKGTLIIYDNKLYLCKTTIENTTIWETDSINTILLNNLNIDFNNYYNKTEIDDKLNNKVNSSQLDLLATKNELTSGLALKQDIGDYVTTEKLTTELVNKQDKGNYMPFVANDSFDVNKVDEDVTIDLSVGNCWVGIIKSENTTPNIIFTNIGKYRIKVTTFSINLSSIANNYVRILTTTTANQSSTSYTSKGYLRTFEITRIE